MIDFSIRPEYNRFCKRGLIKRRKLGGFGCPFSVPCFKEYALGEYQKKLSVLAFQRLMPYKESSLEKKRKNKRKREPPSHKSCARREFALAVVRNRETMIQFFNKNEIERNY